MIRFGTSGWRALIGDTFTFRNVRLVTQAIANLLRPERGAPKRVVVGYDTRFLSEKVAHETAVVLSSCRVEAIRLSRDAPTPALCLTIRKREAQGGIYFTASHNPPEYNGLKYYSSTGAPATDVVTRAIEEEVVRLERAGYRGRYLANERYVLAADPQSVYLKHLAASLDLDRISRSGLKLVVDPLYGTARDYLDRLLIEHGCNVEVIHNFTDPYFGGYSPECSERNLAGLSEAVVGSEADLGIATDGDGDRFGVVDSDGSFFSADQVLPLLLDYLVRDKELSGSVARTLSTTHMVDAVAAHYGLGVKETPVGFKYIAEGLLGGEVSFGCEQSAGLALADHMPEKDGVLACLLLAEMAASSGKSLGQLRKELEKVHGRFVQRRLDLDLTTNMRRRLATLGRRPPRELSGLAVQSVSQLDGVKLVMEGGGWCLARRSGTEPLLRLYAEAASIKKAERLLGGLRALVADQPEARPLPPARGRKGKARRTRAG